MKGNRNWCGLCQYAGMAEFYLGTVVAGSEMEAMEALKVLWADLSPHPFPDKVVMMPGSILFSPQGGGDD